MDTPSAVVNVTVRENSQSAPRTTAFWKVAALIVAIGGVLELAVIASELHSINRTLAVIAVSTMESNLSLDGEALEQSPMREARRH